MVEQYATLDITVHLVLQFKYHAQLVHIIPHKGSLLWQIAYSAQPVLIVKAVVWHSPLVYVTRITIAHRVASLPRQSFVPRVSCVAQDQPLRKIVTHWLPECIKIKLDKAHVNNVLLDTDVTRWLYNNVVRISIVHLETWTGFNAQVEHLLDYIMLHL